LLLLRQRPGSELVGDAGQLANKCPKLIQERDNRRRHDEPLMGRMTLNAQLLEDVEVSATNRICEGHARPKDMSDVSDGCQPNELRTLKEFEIHQLHPFGLGRVIREPDRCRQ
jgi:hypothetical protein